MPQGILQDDDGDLLLVDGSMTSGETTYQQQKDLLLIDKGEFIRHLDAGVGLVNYLDDEDESVLSEVTRQFQKDGMIVEKVTMDNIIARYKQ